jgi:hypothetical protein
MKILSQFVSFFLMAEALPKKPKAMLAVALAQDLHTVARE